MFGKQKSVAFYYGVIILVVILWGIYPVVTNYLYNYYSPSICSFFYYGVSALTLLAIYFKKLKNLTKDCLKTAVLTGLVMGVANVTIKIGLFYTTPSNYAFLENLQMVFVPIVLFIMYRQKPSLITVFCSIMCVLGCACLCGIFEGFNVRVGDILCCIATIFFGISIAVTGNSVRKYDPCLFVMIQLAISAILALLTSLALNFIKINGAPIEPIKFSFDITLIAISIVVAVIAGAICWALRTVALKHIDINVYTIILAFSAIVTSVLSIIVGTDQLTTSLVIGASLIFASIVISGASDIITQKRLEKSKEIDSNKND